ncbi:GrpB family protein [Oscillospiraceae bacterium OttesenSCG-928-G22]|nr:GrpB family protein [Oscillospiraceae bacterium OttesenSCG-928-G22]
MQKSLDDMTNEELWALFPIVLSESDPMYPDLFRLEASLLRDAIGFRSVARLSHIGSTAVPGLLAKPTIDILLELTGATDLEALDRAMDAAGYRLVPQPEKPPPHRMYLKGYTPEGFKGQVFHAHVRYFGDWDELYFRDYLRRHPDAAEQYARLKSRLAEEYANDRDGYTEAKTEFIAKHTSLARAEIGAIYAP